MCVPDVICRCLYIYFKMVDPFIDTGGIVDHHRLSKLSLHNVLLLEMPFRHGYCLFVLYPHPVDLSMNVGINIIDASRDLIISIRHNMTYLSIKYYEDYLI